MFCDSSDDLLVIMLVRGWCHCQQVTNQSGRISSNRSRVRQYQWGEAMRPMRNSRSLNTRFFSGSNSSSRRWSRFTKPITTRLSPMFKVPHSLHSRLTGASALRGGFTTEDGQARSPACWSSSSPYGKEAAHLFIASAKASSTRLTTNSWVSRIFLDVSFGVPRSEEHTSELQSLRH